MMKLTWISKRAAIYGVCFVIMLSWVKVSHSQLAIVEQRALNFGSLAFVTGGGTSEVDLNFDGTYTSSNIAFVATPTSGIYLLTGGTPSATYNLAIDSTVNLDGPTSTKHFIIDNIVVNPTSGVFNAFGEGAIQVGGRLRTNVTSSQYPNEVYTNTIDITLSY